MHSTHVIHKSAAKKRARLYSFVFASNISLFVVTTLLVSFLLQPFHKALAQSAEEEQLDALVTADDVSPQTPIVESAEESQEVLPVAPDVAADQTPQTESIDAPEAETEVDNGTTSVEAEETAPVLQTENSTSSVTNTATSSLDGAEPTATSSGTFASTTDEATEPTTTHSSSTASTSLEEQDNDQSGAVNSDTNEEATSSTPIVETEIPNENSEEVAVSSGGATSSTTTTPVTQTIVEAQYLVTDENFYQFSRQSCVAVGDGTYHCTTKTDPELDQNAVVYAEHGPSGNMEIFLRTAKGEIRQLTDNEYDDTAPYYDAETLTIVWQRLIDDRYQIIEYDISEAKESQLTFSRTNNMQPKVSAEGVVWQAWDNNDWEIMYFDGKYTDQLTDNITQDVTPVIEDGYILWSVLGKSAQEARVYSLKSGEMLSITGHEGGVIENPRFVLVYDTKFENGDIVTQGFDPVTGLSAPISAKPAEKPIDIPTPDPIGEIRALIQNKSPHEDDLYLDNSDQTPDDLDLNLASSSNATSTDTLNLKTSQVKVIGADETVVVGTSSIATTTPFELTDFDLVITKDATSSTSTKGENAQY
ncbi:MAG: hypothetical protein AAB388_00695 [Patescibacteria group bacterium]